MNIDGNQESHLAMNKAKFVPNSKPQPKWKDLEDKACEAKEK
jgi:hypothetical protein